MVRNLECSTVMNHKILFSIVVLTSFSAFSQIERSTYTRATELLGGINRCEKPDFDEYKFVEDHTRFTRAYPLEEGQPADFDHEIESLMFSEAAGSSYRFSQCQRKLYDHLEKGLQDAGDYRALALRRAAWLQFNYLRSQINKAYQDLTSARSSARTVRSGISYGDPGERAMMAGQSALGLETQSDRLVKAEADVARVTAHLRSLVSRIPLGNRPEMKDAMVALARHSGLVSEAQFNNVFKTALMELNKQSLKSVQFWEGTDGVNGAGNVTTNSTGDLIARVNNDLKISLIQSGQMEMIVNARGMADRSHKEFMCRTQARYIQGPQTRDGILTVASMIGGYGLARLAVRAGLKAATALSAAGRVSARMVQVPAMAAWIGLEATAMGIDVDHARRVCFKPEFLAGANEDQCSFESEYNGAFLEASAAECLTSSILAAAPAGMSVMGVLSALPRTIRAVDGSLITTNLPGIREMIDYAGDGGRVTRFDGGITLTERGGIKITEYPEGSSVRKMTERPGEYVETQFADGRVNRHNADGSRIETDTDGYRVTYDKDGKITSESGRAPIIVSATIDDVRVRGTYADTAIRGIRRDGLTGREASSTLTRLGFRKLKDAPEGLLIYRNSRNGATLKFKDTGKPRLSNRQAQEIKEILVTREGEFVHPDALARTRAVQRQGDDISEELAEIRSSVGNRMDDPEIAAYVRDELKTHSSLSDAQRARARTKLINSVRNWDANSNAVNRLVVRARQARYNRDVARFEKQYRRQNPDADDAAVSSFSRRAAAQKRARVAELRGMCTSFKPNAANLRAGALFASYSGGMGAINTGISYGLATWDSDISRTEWGIRLTYEVVLTYLFNRWTAKITSRPDASFLQRVTQQSLLAFGANIFEAGIYQIFFDSKDKAREHLDKVTSSPTFKDDINKLIDHVNTMNHIERVVDGIGDFSNNLYRKVTGQEELRNLTVDELEALDQNALKDPVTQEELLDLIDDQMLSANRHTTGNEAVDRLAYNTVYNFASVPVNMAVGILSFQAVCMNLDSPIKAMAAFGSITIVRQNVSGYLFFESREQVLGTQ
jgi:hypothetical protein